MSDYETTATGMRILPGQWRPHYPWEQIIWISPSWPCQDYLWYDFPEGVLSDAGTHYCSAMNDAIPDGEILFTELPAIPWQETDGRFTCEREMPGGITCVASLKAAGESIVRMELELTNTGNEPLTNVTGRTCLFLRATRDFGEYGGDNKFAHLGEHGWVSHTGVYKCPHDGPYPVHAPEVGACADIPVSICLSAIEERLVAMTWFDDTLKVGGNPVRPCLHADPNFGDLAPGESKRVHGEIIFFEGTPDDFLDYWKDRT